MKISSLEHKKIAMLGFGVTGQEVYKALGPKYDITLINDTPIPGYDIQSTAEAIAANQTFDVIIKSPGILYSHPLLATCDARVTNDIELCYEVICENQLNTKIIGITGTNGKTTTTQFIADCLCKTGKVAIACGNIGQSPLYVLSQNLHVDYLVIELSSYQLKQVDKFKPDFGLFLNIAPDHIDYHGSFEDYLTSKCKLFMNMTEQDGLVLDRSLVDDYPEIKWPSFASFGVSDSQLQSIKTMAMPKQNYRLIFDLLLKVGIDQEYIIAQINKFQGLEHRLELVESNHDYIVINDSKATNVEATNVAISNLTSDATLIVGGSEKVEDYTRLNYASKFVNHVIAYGAAKDNFNFIPNIILIDDFTSAVKKAMSITKANEVLILSPACASFDQHQNYIERGNQFKQIIRGENE
ncbi:UDP-N-acetylmuramoyl-L-alanine--D-glutamate ligase [Mollicutes bacterium LVI A0039]|nr:UDP-N-acetylmuramoyl-L-alanine--D-glutamate ligase [Mollicutes bacterium LVI A0039]